MGGWEGYTGTLPGPVPGPQYYTILKVRPYPRPNEGLSEGYDEVSQIWPQIDPQIDLRMDPE